MFLSPPTLTLSSSLRSRAHSSLPPSAADWKFLSPSPLRHRCCHCRLSTIFVFTDAAFTVFTDVPLAEMLHTRGSTCEVYWFFGKLSSVKIPFLAAHRKCSIWFLQAMRVLVLSGNGPKGKAEAALWCIGAPVLTDFVADVAEALTMVAVISTLITCYAQNGPADRALQLFSLMSNQDVCPDEVTLSSVVNACSCLSADNVGYQV